MCAQLPPLPGVRHKFSKPIGYLEARADYRQQQMHLQAARIAVVQHETTELRVFCVPAGGKQRLHMKLSPLSQRIWSSTGFGS